MELTEEQKEGLNLALDEATLLSCSDQLGEWLPRSVTAHGTILRLLSSRFM
jgi:hypothetical protein